MIYLYIAGFFCLLVAVTVPLAVWLIRVIDRRDKARRKTEGNVTVSDTP